MLFVNINIVAMYLLLKIYTFMFMNILYAFVLNYDKKYMVRRGENE